METTALETSIVQLGEFSSTEVLLEAGDKLARLGEFLKEMRGRWEAAMVQRIESAGPIQDGEILYRVGNPPKTTCNDNAAAVEAVLIAVGGDFGKLCEHLSSGALKHGACKGTLAEADYARLFTVTREPELQADPATPKRLAKINLAFMRPARTALPAGA